MAQSPTVLCILDGWGLSDTQDGNAVALAKTPNYDRIMRDFPNATLITHGIDVGLPEGQMGNSEVGHMNIGAGRVVEMDLRRIEAAIEGDTFAQLPAILRFIEALRESDGTAHLCGVLSDGGVHSHIDHLIETIRVLNEANIPVALHLFSDGRDVAPQSALQYLDVLEASLFNAKIATISGRYFALDRDNRWERVEKAFRAIRFADAPKAANARNVITSAYASDVTDEFIEPSVIGDYAGLEDGDGLLFLNFRADRARQILMAIGAPEFDAFDRGSKVALSVLTGFAQYSVSHDAYMDCVFPDQDIKNTLGEWVAQHDLKQFRIAETEKYPHVTFFLNGGIEAPFKNEDRYLASSPKVATYDLKPEMSEAEVTENLVNAIGSDYALIVVNYANPDMVGHTGDLNAAIKACEAVDNGLGQVIDALNDAGGAMILCADHGNCEVMINPETGEPHTAHTTNPVPVALIGAPHGQTIAQGGRLADLAPSLLDLMGLEKPKEMTGQSLIKNDA